MSRKRHNPERRIFRARSHKKHGQRLTVLQNKADQNKDLREQSVGIGNDAASALCGRCSKNPSEPEHYCPYNQELGDGEATCDCCDDCRHECAMDI